ncbi:MAG: hypothetical protein AAF242_13840, partial [Bacteroidota bacterium]
MKAIFLDLFDTLVYVSRETDPYQAAYEQFFSKRISLEDFRQIALTKTYDSLQALGQALDLNHPELRELDSMLEDEVQSVRLFQEVPTVLERLSQLSELYVIS